MLKVKESVILSGWVQELKIQKIQNIVTDQSIEDFYQQKMIVPGDIITPTDALFSFDKSSKFSKEYLTSILPEALQLKPSYTVGEAAEITNKLFATGDSNPDALKIEIKSDLNFPAWHLPLKGFKCQKIISNGLVYGWPLNWACSLYLSDVLKMEIKSEMNLSALHLLLKVSKYEEIILDALAYVWHLLLKVYGYEEIMLDALAHGWPLNGTCNLYLSSLPIQMESESITSMLNKFDVAYQEANWVAPRKPSITTENAPYGRPLRKPSVVMKLYENAQCEIALKELSITEPRSKIRKLCVNTPYGIARELYENVPQEIALSQPWIAKICENAPDGITLRQPLIASELHKYVPYRGPLRKPSVTIARKLYDNAPCYGVALREPSIAGELYEIALYGNAIEKPLIARELHDNAPYGIALREPSIARELWWYLVAIELYLSPRMEIHPLGLDEFIDNSGFNHFGLGAINYLTREFFLLPTAGVIAELPICADNQANYRFSEQRAPCETGKVKCNHPSWTEISFD